ncbi:MAG: FadR family transcriptional regulator [Syntrophaceae bacterium]|nr:FadR family transcriptional regulator [Syntrophaceae bacterium]
MTDFLGLKILKSQSLIEKTCESLTDLVLAGKLGTGDYLPPESEIAERLGVGRSTVREAVKVLESKGLVRRLHGKGIQIVDESRKAASEMLQLMLRREKSSVGELLEVRRLIEMKMASLAAGRATAKDLSDLRKILKKMQSTGTTTAEDVETDLTFHEAVAKATQNNILRLVFESIRPLLLETILTCLNVAPKNELSKAYHKKILEAIEARDPQGAAAAVGEHLDGTEEMLKQAGIDINRN